MFKAYELSESKISSQECQWCRHAKPECQKSNHRSERKRSTTPSGPQESVHYKHQREDNSANGVE